MLLQNKPSPTSTRKKNYLQLFAFSFRGYRLAWATRPSQQFCPLLSCPLFRLILSEAARLMRTSLLVTGLSLNRSQCGGCSTKYGTPTDEPESFANDFALQLRHGVDLSNARGGKSAGHLRLLLWLYHRALTRESDARQLRPRAGRCAQSIGALGGVPA